VPTSCSCDGSRGVPFPGEGDVAGVPVCAAPGEHAPTAHEATSISAVANGFMESSIRDDNRKADARLRKTVKGLLVRVKTCTDGDTQRGEARGKAGGLVMRPDSELLTVPAVGRRASTTAPTESDRANP
jgi:hypothetical protein